MTAFGKLEPVFTRRMITHAHAVGPFDYRLGQASLPVKLQPALKENKQATAGGNHRIGNAHRCAADNFDKLDMDANTGPRLLRNTAIGQADELPGNTLQGILHKIGPAPCCLGLNAVLGDKPVDM